MSDSSNLERKHNFFNNMHHLTNNIFDQEDYVKVEGSRRSIPKGAKAGKNTLHVRKSNNLVLNIDEEESFAKKMDFCNKYKSVYYNTDGNQVASPSSALGSRISPTSPISSIFNNIENFNKNKAVIENLVRVPAENKSFLPPIEKRHNNSNGLKHLLPPKIPNYKIGNNPANISPKAQALPRYRISSADDIRKKENSNDIFYHKNEQIMKNKLIDSLDKQKSNQELYKSSVLRLNNQREQEISNYIETEISRKDRKDSFDFYEYMKNKKQLEKVYQEMLMTQINEKKLLHAEIKSINKSSIDSIAKYMKTEESYEKQMKENQNLIKQKYREFLNSQIVDSIQNNYNHDNIPVQKRIYKKRLYEDMKKNVEFN